MVVNWKTDYIFPMKFVIHDPRCTPSYIYIYIYIYIYVNLFFANLTGHYCDSIVIDPYMDKILQKLLLFIPAVNPNRNISP